MAKNSTEAYGASGKTNVLNFQPEALHLIDDPAHPLYDERIHLPLSEAMVLNIMEYGVLEPIIVWKDPETGKTCVVDGRQRVRHALEANIRQVKQGKDLLLVPGVAKRGSAVRMSNYMVSANEIRQADTPLGRAKKMAALLDRNHDEEDLALMFGCSVKTVQATLTLLDCTQVVQDAVEAGKVNVTQARLLSVMPPEAQREKVKELAQVGEEATGHQRARRQREVMGDVKPRIKSRKEINQALCNASGEYAAALRWVLGEVQTNE
ncbi:ParB/RepB/Spo0J family partition protein [Pantoea coffeiphila]|uniref:ParB/Spo0J HTH domain-containing protein n=1 Tax=Pantoea coffeiphila TaxID=1465635 RepID=A0A2S9I890_9GAMM|nr:hypothetical protein [Pantoea coffeiphila]PRD14017.1 hypothetical protein CQW29_18615 [Pantoea coffeiphila]